MSAALETAHADQGECARLLLRTIQGRSGLVELRALGAPRAIRQWYDDPAQAAAHALDADPRLDVYVGAVARCTRASGRHALADHGRHVWADCDATSAIAALADFPVEPTFVIESGGVTAEGVPKLHAWWLTLERLTLATVEHVNRRLALALGADPHAVDPTRILRLPGTFNQKTGRPVRMIRLGDDRSVLDLDAALPELPHTMDTTAVRATRRASTWLHAIPATRYVAALSGREVGRDGKTLCPLHDERTPSLHAYAKPERGWFCFGCRRGGDIFTFAGLLWGLDTRRDFGVLNDRLAEALA